MLSQRPFPAGFALALQNAEAEFTVPPPRPASGPRRWPVAGRRFSLSADVLIPPAADKASANEDLQPCGGRPHRRALDGNGREVPTLRRSVISGGPGFIRSSRNSKRPSPITPNILPGNRATSKSIFNRGVCHQLSGSREKALADYNEAIQSQSAGRRRPHAAGLALL